MRAVVVCGGRVQGSREGRTVLSDQREHVKIITEKMRVN